MQIQPGQYKIDRDFVSDKTKEIRKDVLGRYQGMPKWKFEHNSRVDDEGILRGVRNPGNVMLWFNPTGPGHYEQVDELDQAERVHWQSAPAFSQRKGEPAEDIRARKAGSLTPGPGHYEPPKTRLEKLGAERAKNLHKAKAPRVCHNAGKFSLIFTRMHASAISGPPKHGMQPIPV